MTGIRQAVILAGGQGIRLRPLTTNLPKPMVRVNDRPFLEYLIDLCKANGITEVVMLLGYLPEKVTDYFKDGSDHGISIRYSIGKIEDSTGTRIRNAANILDDTFLLMYGDNYWPLNVRNLHRHFSSHNVLVSTTVFANKDGKGEYGMENNICVDDEGYVVRYDKSRKDHSLNGVDIGFFVVDKTIIDLMPETDFSFEEILLPELIKERRLAGYFTDHRYHSISNQKTLKETEAYLRHDKVVMLDRDGVINRKMSDGDYVKNWSEFEFLPGSVEALRLLTQNGYDLFIITNQRGISRNLMSSENVEHIHLRMTVELKKQGVDIKAVYICPHGLEDNCACRKPKPGLLFQAASEYDFNLTKAVFIGDNQSDLQAGEAAGCKTILVQPEHDLLKVVKELIRI